MYRGFSPRCIFFVYFFKKTVKKFIFGAIFVVIDLSHLMHSVGAIFIMSCSECAPESLSA